MVEYICLSPAWAIKQDPISDKQTKKVGIVLNRLKVSKTFHHMLV